MRNERAAAKNDFLSSLRMVLVGTSVGAVVCILLLLVSSFLLVAIKRIPQGVVAPLGMVIAAFAAFVAGYSSGRISKSKGFFYGLCSGALLFLILFLTGVIVVGETLSLSTLIKLGLMFLFGTIGGIFGVNKKKKARR